MGQPAARLTDMHVCPLSTGPVPHIGGPIIGPCAPTVLIGKLPAARISDLCVCIGPPDVIVKGSPTVIISGMPAARIGDQTAHGGVIILGWPTVLIGDAAGGGGGGGGGPAGNAPAPPKKDESALEIFFEFAAKLFHPTEDAEATRQMKVEYELSKRELELKRFGDEDNHLRLGAYDDEVKASASFDIDKGQFEAGVEVSASVAAAKAQAKGTTAKGLLAGEVKGEVLSATAKAEAGAGFGAEGAQAKVGASIEAIAVKGEVGGEVRITPKTLYDNSIGRLTDTALPKSWDKGVVLGATGEAGIGAGASAKAEAVAKAGELTLSAEARAGLGPLLGGKFKAGLVW